MTEVTVKQGILPDEYTVYYDGMLSEAEQVYLHFGAGYPDWTRIQTVKMDKAGAKWQKTVTMSGHWSMCFTDHLGNWDNNDGRNWTGR